MFGGGTSAFSTSTTPATGTFGNTQTQGQTSAFGGNGTSTFGNSTSMFGGGSNTTSMFGGSGSGSMFSGSNPTNGTPQTTQGSAFSFGQT